MPTPVEFHPIFVPGDLPPLLVLHGTGGNERSLLEVANYVAPGSALLGVRGRSLDEGVPRFFRRLREGVFDQEDLLLKTQELSEFLRQASEEHEFVFPIDTIGYSNGANMALSLLFRFPADFGRLVLFRPMLPFSPSEEVSLEGKSVFVASGRNDPLATVAESKKLIEVLQKRGANVTEFWATTGHSLGREDFDQAREFLTHTLRLGQ